MAQKNSSTNETFLKILGFLWIPLLICGIWVVREIIGIEDTERVVENVKFSSITKYSDQIASGTTCYKPEGMDGIVVKNYKVIKHFGKETSRKLINEEITREVKNEVRVVGTAPKYDGYCSIEGTYRHRYVVCNGNYSPKSKREADEQALKCNTSIYNESGCYSTFHSSNYDDTKTCSQIKVEDL